MEQFSLLWVEKKWVCGMDNWAKRIVNQHVTGDEQHFIKWFGQQIGNVYQGSLRKKNKSKKKVMIFHFIYIFELINLSRSLHLDWIGHFIIDRVLPHVSPRLLAFIVLVAVETIIILVRVFLLIFHFNYDKND